MRARIRHRAVPVLLLAVAAGLLVQAPVAHAAPAGYHKYVALGDSWTADVVLLGTAGTPTGKYVPVDCFQSTFNYPKQVAKALEVESFFDASCGSATTEHFFQPQSGLPFGGTNPPQLSRLTPDTDLVTVGIGGNDAELAGAVIDCLNVTGSLVAPLLPLPYPLAASCKARWTAEGVDRMSENIAAAEPKVVAALQAVHDRSPDADVFLVNYLAGIRGPGCYPLVQASNADQVWLAEKLQELNAMLVRAAEAGGARLVDTYTATIGHDVCKLPTVRYAEAFLPVSLNQPAVAVPFHPNSAGADAQATAVLSAITSSRA
ncbi:SGNH/GDSL hydrolase family protein [Pseudonocardia sp. CA-107938]|uniref:SGNH/GDSL hydrolase family protein n=1 Tax=Pseudonocardia sp. CA-107938 TaxID=3240021 RepID=UPI003D8E2EB9